MADSAQAFLDSLQAAANITALVGRPEDLYFEAKRCSVPMSDADKNHLAEALSGFANSDGGVMVYGLVASGGDKRIGKPDVVTKVERIKQLSHLCAEVNTLVGQLVEPPAEGVQVLPRPSKNLSDEGFALVYIPRSESFLHRSRRDREFYRRHGDGFHRMEHYEIAEFYGRRKNPSLVFWWSVATTATSGSAPRRRFDARIVVGLQNVGRGIAEYPALLLKNRNTDRYGLDGNGNTGLPQRPTTRPGVFFGGGAEYVVHPGGVLEVTRLADRLEVSEDRPECPDFCIDYEIYAKDMPEKSGTEVMKGAEIIRRVLELRR